MLCLKEGKQAQIKANHHNDQEHEEEKEEKRGFLLIVKYITSTA